MLYSKLIRPEHFVDGLDADTRRRLFKQSVRLVSIETFSFCNRKCWFCPNSFIDRFSTNHVMKEELLAMIVGDLGAVDFDGTVNLSGYNEPLASPVIVEHIRRVRSDVPKSEISLFSNGDYLDRPLLDQLHDAGLNKLFLSIHTGNREDLNDAKVERRIEYYRNKCGLDVRMTHDEPGVKYKGNARFRDMFIQLYEPNMRTEGSNMGGLIEGLERQYHRTCPCLEPLWHLTIEFDGHVVPCCRIRSDADAHEGLAICDLNDVSSIFEAYGHANAASWRRSVSVFGEKESPCGSCDNDLLKDTWFTRREFAKVEDMIAGSRQPD